MGVKVKILERDFSTGTPNIYYRVFPKADYFEVLMDQNQEQTHLRVIENSQQVAFFPSGGWLGVELIKEN
jgi:hypothetical protein